MLIYLPVLFFPTEMMGLLGSKSSSSVMFHPKATQRHFIAQRMHPHVMSRTRLEQLAFSCGNASLDTFNLADHPQH